MKPYPTSEPAKFFADFVMWALASAGQLPKDYQIGLWRLVERASKLEDEHR